MTQTALLTKSAVMTWYNKATAAAQLLVTENMGRYKYTTQYNNNTTLWRYDVSSGVRLTVSVAVDGTTKS